MTMQSYASRSGYGCALSYRSGVRWERISQYTNAPTSLPRPCWASRLRASSAAGLVSSLSTTYKGSIARGLSLLRRFRPNRLRADAVSWQGVGMPAATRLPARFLRKGGRRAQRPRFGSAFDGPGLASSLAPALRASTRAARRGHGRKDPTQRRGAPTRREPTLRFFGKEPP